MASTSQNSRRRSARSPATSAGGVRLASTSRLLNPSRFFGGGWPAQRVRPQAGPMTRLRKEERAPLPAFLPEDREEKLQPARSASTRAGSAAGTLSSLTTSVRTSKRLSVLAPKVVLIATSAAS